MKRNILILSNNIGGLYSFRKEVLKAIIDLEYYVYISVPNNNDERISYFESIGCRIIKSPFDSRGMNPIADIRLMLSYVKIIRQLNPLAVLSYTIKPNVYGGIACRITTTPLLANVTGLGDAVENGGWLQHLTVFLYKIGLSKAYTVFFQNKANRDFFLKNSISSQSSILLPGSGVNLDFHKLQPYPPAGAAIKFLFIGRLLKDKGIDEYLSMASYVKKLYPETEFQVLGSCGDNYKNKLNLLQAEGIVNYLGTTLDVRPYIADVHCTIMPSYHEGMSNVNLESAACGRPVITTNIPGCMETVTDGITGYLVKPCSKEDLIDKVLRFIELTYEEKYMMGVEGRKKIEKEFDRQIVISSYINQIELLKQTTTF